MKNYFLPFHQFFHGRLAALALCSLCAGSMAQAQLNAVFTVPPYTLDGSIVGIDGWEMVYGPESPIYNDPMQASVVSSPVSDAAQPTALDLKTAVKNTRSELPGSKALIETTFAVTFVESYHFTGGVVFSLARDPAKSPVLFGFDYSEGGGLYFQSGQEKVIVLPREQVVPEASYQFQIKIDLDKGSFRVVVNGVKNDGTPFHYESPDTGYLAESDHNPLSEGIYIFNKSPTVVQCYIDRVNIAAVPGQ